MYSIVIADTGPPDIAKAESYILASGLPLQVIGRFEDGLFMRAFLKVNPADIVVANIILPGRGALDIARDMAAGPRRSLFIVMSSFEQFSYDHARAAIEVGAVSYLLKPLDPEILIGALTKAVDRLAAAPREGEATMAWSTAPPAGGSESAALAERIYRYITTHYMEPLSVADIRNRFNVSESYINKLLIRYRGKSFIKILTEIRIAEATRMMGSYPDLPIQDIAYAVGYNDPHYFSRVYKAITGVPPSQEKKEKTQEVYGYGKR